jgi:hypothetical protein
MVNALLGCLSLSMFGAGLAFGYYFGNRASHHAGIKIGTSEATSAVRRDWANGESALKDAVLKRLEMRLQQLKQSLDHDMACIPSQLDTPTNT